MVAVSVGALGQDFAAGVAGVVAVSIGALGQHFAAGVAGMVAVSVGALGQDFAAEVTGVVAVSVGALGQHFAAGVTGMVFVIIGAGFGLRVGDAAGAGAGVGGRAAVRQPCAPKVLEGADRAAADGADGGGGAGGFFRAAAVVADIPPVLQMKVLGDGRVKVIGCVPRIPCFENVAGRGGLRRLGGRFAVGHGLRRRSVVAEGDGVARLVAREREVGGDAVPAGIAVGDLLRAAVHRQNSTDDRSAAPVAGLSDVEAARQGGEVKDAARIQREPVCIVIRRTVRERQFWVRAEIQ